MSKKFAWRLHLVRQRLGWSQEEIAKKVGVNRSTVCKWEQGTIEPGLDTIEKLAGVLGVSAAELAGFENLKGGCTYANGSR